MRKLLLILVVLFPFLVMAQLSPVTSWKIQDNTTDFETGIAVGTTIHDLSTNRFYLCITTAEPNENLTSAAAKFQELSNSAILYVGFGRRYTTIQAAVNVAGIGDIIKIDTGTYTEAVTITNKTNLTLEAEVEPNFTGSYTAGELTDGVIINGSITIKGSSAILVKNVGINITSSDPYGILIYSNVSDGNSKNITIKNIIVQGTLNAAEHGFLVESSLNLSSEVLIENCRCYYTAFGFVVKAMDVKLINCFAGKQSKFGFDVCSDNIAGATTRSYSKNVIVDKCTSDSAGLYSFVVYTKDFSDLVNASNMVGYESKNIQFNHCTSMHSSLFGMGMGVYWDGTWPAVGDGTSAQRENTNITINNCFLEKNTFGLWLFAVDSVKIANVTYNANGTAYGSGTHALNVSYPERDKEPTITAGTTAQYWRGDKSWQTLPSPSSIWATNGTSIYYNTGSVGFGVTAPLRQIHMSNNFQSDATTTASLIGASIASGAINENTDGLYIGRTASSSYALRALNVVAEGNTSSSLNISAINGLVTTLSSCTTSFNGTTAGGNLRNRYQVTHNGSGTVTQGSAVTALITNNGGTATTLSSYHAEPIVVASGKTVTNYNGLWIRGGSVTGTLTNRYGLHIDDMIGGTNRWGIYQEGAGDSNYLAGPIRMGAVRIGSNRISIGLVTSTYPVDIFSTTTIGINSENAHATGVAIHAEAYDAITCWGDHIGVTAYAPTGGVAGGYFYSTGSAIGLKASSVSGYAAIFDQGNVGIGLTSPLYKCHTNGVNFSDSSSFTGRKAYGNSGTSINIYCSQGNLQTITRTGNCTYTLIGMKAGQTIRIIFTHEASTTSYTVGFSPNVAWPGGSAPTWSQGSGEIDMFEITYDGTNYLGTPLGLTYGL